MNDSTQRTNLMHFKEALDLFFALSTRNYTLERGNKMYSAEWLCGCTTMRRHAA